MIAIVKYNAGNIGSVKNALDRLKVPHEVTEDPAKLQNADGVIFPGVGEAGSAMRYLRERGLDDVIKNLKQPVLGICLGLQLMCKHSEEGETECLGIFDAEVKKFRSTEFKVPHMGWNSIGYFKSSRMPDFTKEIIVSDNHSSPTGDHRGSSPEYLTATKSQYLRNKDFAKQLRKEMTEAEKILWSQIRNKKLGVQFHRQKPVGPFIPDFVCSKLKLIIEVDGEIHKFRKTQDAERTSVLNELGYTVFRVDNMDVHNYLRGVLGKLKRIISDLSEHSLTLAASEGTNDFVKPQDLTKDRKSKLLRTINTSDDFYYVHSYYASICKQSKAVCDYINPFSSVLQKDNFYATQFHPEKSAAVGEQLLRNFVSLTKD